MTTAKSESNPLIYSLKIHFSSKRMIYKVNQMLRAVAILTALFFFNFGFAQTFTFSGGISNDNGTAESGVSVVAKSGGATVESSTTSSSGRYKLELPYGKSYTIEISKPGFSKRFYNVDLSNVKEENLSSGEDFASQNITILAETPGVDMSAITSQPVTSYTFTKKTGMLTKDAGQESASQKAEQNIKTQKEKAAAGGGVNKAELEKQLKEKIKLGDAAMTAKDYDKAEKAFLDAVDFAVKNKLDDTEAQKKLDEADIEKRKRDEAALKDKQESAAFSKVLDEAKKLEAKKEFAKAKEKLEEAKALKPDNKEVDDLLKKVTQAIADQESAEKLNADYQQAMTEGNQLFDEKNYEQAIKKYEEAKKLKPSEKDPPLKITASQNKLKDQKEEAEKTAKFEALLTQANALKDAEKYDDAIKKYEEAQLIIKDRTEPKEGIDFCKTKKKEAEDLAKSAADLAKRDADYNAAIKKADDLFKADKFKEAIKEYENASIIKSEEDYPKNQITLANEKINELAGAEERKKQFEQLKKDGEKALNQKQLAEAKDKFTQANSILEGDAFVLAKLAEIEKLEQENAAASAKEEQYKDLMSRAETALSGESYTEAKDLFTQASNLKPNEQTPKQKLELIEKKIKEQAADLEKKQKFDNLVSSANAKEASKDLKGALEDFNKAYELIKDTQVKAKMDQIQADILNEANAAERKKKYDDAVLKADVAKNAKDWEKAIQLFKDAKAIDASQTYPDEQITIAEQELAKLKGAQERLNIFNKLSADAEKNFKDKKYKEAEANYKEALNFADAESDVRKTNDKLSELNTILDAIEGEARKEQAFNEALTAAQNFEKEDKLKEALEKYQEAKSIKPDATLPPQKEKEIAGILEKREKEAKQKALFEDLINQGDALFTGAKFQDAIKKYQEAMPIFPENDIPKKKIEEVNKKIEELANDEKEQAYQKILTDAQNKRVDGKLDEALKLYNEALKERPSDLVPKEKIQEIQEEIEEIKRKEAELLAKRAKYAELLKQASDEFTKNDLKKALEIYSQAQQTLPDEADEANKKIEQINNILASEEAAKQAELEKLNQLNDLIASGDLAFKQDRYDAALETYQQAQNMAPSNDVIAQKIKITQDRITDLEKSKQEKLINDKLIAADKAFADRKYDDALDLYTELLELKPGHKKAQDQIALIERIKKPASDIAELPDLGTPALYSILEGEALLSQAERQREFLRLKKLRDHITSIEEKRLEDSKYKTEDIRSTYLKTKEITDELEKDPTTQNLDQWILDQIIRDRLGDMSELEKIENILSYKELMDMQARIRILSEQQVDGVNGNIKIPAMNEEELKVFLKELAGKQDVSKTDQLELLLKNEAFLHGIYNLHESDDAFSKALTELNNLLLTSLFYDLKHVSPEQLEARQAYLDKVIESLNSYAEDLNTRTDNNYSKVSEHDIYIKDVYESSNEVVRSKNQQSYEERQKMLEALRLFGDLMTEQNNENIESQRVFQNEVVRLQTTNTDVYLATMLSNYFRLHGQDQAIKKLVDFDSKDYELWLNDIKNAYSELKEINRLVLKENDRISEEKTKNAYKNTKDINELIVERSYKTAEDHTKQTETAKTVQDADRSASDKQQANLNKAKKNIEGNRALLDQLERRELKFNEAAANKLGEQFPEGVTEENFITKDDDDIVVEVKTRRIVVVNGRGNVYMRYSNRFGVTFTKNGESITEYQWVKETQNAKLQKYKIN